MKLVDVHCHLDDPQFAADLPQVLVRAKKAGVVGIITNAIEPAAFPILLNLAKKNDIIKVAFGLYPDTVRDLAPTQIEQALQQIVAQKNHIVAIGEIGLDYKNTIDDSGREKQKKYFVEQLNLAKKLAKPVIIHSRNAEEDCLQILAQQKQEDVVLHCFCGTQAQVEFAKEQGFFFSIPVRAKSSKQFQMIIKTVPISRLLTETDAPYLHYKQERNEPANVATTIYVIAKIKGMDSIEVSNNILANYIKLFSRK